MEEKVIDGIVEVKKIKIKYDGLKKLGYKLSYGTKEKDYVDINFVKKLDDTTSYNIWINEKTSSKRIHTANYDNNGQEPFTNEEILAVAEILKQIC